MKWRKGNHSKWFIFYARRSNSISNVPADNLRKSVFLILLRVSENGHLFVRAICWWSTVKIRMEQSAHRRPGPLQPRCQGQQEQSAEVPIECLITECPWLLISTPGGRQLKTISCWFWLTARGQQKITIVLTAVINDTVYTKCLRS